MNIFGLNILTPKEMKDVVNEAIAAAFDAKKEEEEKEVDDPSVLESAKFARVYNKGTAREMLETIRLNARDAERNSKLALYVSIPHQAIFLLGIVPLAFGNLIEILSSICLLAVSVILPYLGDRAILMCIRNIATRVISPWDRAKAFGILIPVTIVSIFLNVAAPGPELLKYACGVLVAYVPLYQIIRTCRPNFKKAGQDETKIREEIANLVDTGTAQKRTRSAASIQQQIATREANKAKKIEEAQKAAQAAAQAAAEAAKLEAERKEALRLRGLQAAETRRLNAEAKALEEAKQARLQARRNRTATTKVSA